MRIWFIFDGVNKMGPFSLEELRSMQLSERTTFWKDGMPRWKKAYEIQELSTLSSLPYDPDKQVDKSRVKLFGLITSGLVLVVMAIYGVMFDSLSESELIEVSFLWVGPVVFGVTGWISSVRGSRHPFIAGLVAGALATALLVLFYMGLWSAL